MDDPYWLFAFLFKRHHFLSLGKLHCFPSKISREWTLAMLQTELPRLSCGGKMPTFGKDGLECFCPNRNIFIQIF